MNIIELQKEIVLVNLEVAILKINSLHNHLTGKRSLTVSEAEKYKSDIIDAVNKFKYELS